MVSLESSVSRASGNSCRLRNLHAKRRTPIVTFMARMNVMTRPAFAGIPPAGAGGLGGDIQGVGVVAFASAMTTRQLTTMTARTTIEVTRRLRVPRGDCRWPGLVVMFALTLTSAHRGGPRADVDELHEFLGIGIEHHRARILPEADAVGIEGVAAQMVGERARHSE